MALHSAKRAEELVRRGDFKAAERLYRGILLSSPRSFEALRGLGILLQRQGRNDEAVERLGAALKVKPDDPIALAEFGLAQAGRGDHTAALASFDRSLTINPAQPAALNYQGVSLLELGRTTLALESFERALALDPGSPLILNNMGNALRDLQRVGEALASYDGALASNPDLAEASNNKAVLLRQLGRFDEAIEYVERAVALRPKAAHYYYRLSELVRLSPDDPRVGAMIALTEDDGLADWERADLHYALARVFADAGEHDRAFSYMLEANGRRRRITPYAEATALGAIASLPDTFTAELMAAGADIGEVSDQPVFILGMPRSGTTLVEQILASHPKVFGAGETGLFNKVLQGCPIPPIDPAAPEVDATAAWSDSMHLLGSTYLAALREQSPTGVARILDKTLENWRLIGLIRLALPNARIVHVQRNALDCCVSCFSRQFTNLPYTYDLGELGRHYRAYSILMEHWRKVAPESILLQVRYEDVVADLEGQARRLVDHCGLEWDSRCLDFHRTDRRVQTASASQVRQPIYDRSIGSWRPYEAYLAPLIEALGPLADR
jgi:Flp pilus assembly protein TadD